MTQIWTGIVNGDDRIIAFIDNTIYKCNPPKKDLENYLQAFRSNAIPAKRTFGIPLSYISEFILQDGKKKIRIILNNGSEEELTITDDALREEIFESLQQIIPAYSMVTQKLTRWQAGKKQLIALLVVVVAFCWILPDAINMEKGNSYEVSGAGRSAISVMMVLATVGFQKVMVVFSCLMAIAILAFIRKTKNPIVYRKIIIRRD